MYYEVSDEVAKSEDTPQITVGDGDIDTIAPVITLSADTETKVLQTTLTATVDDGCKIEYRIGEFGLWKEYTEPIIVSLNETYYFLAMDEEGNIGTNEITFANIDTSGVLLSTLWAQKGINPMGGNTTILYNEYTPLDPSVSPEAHCKTGCVSTASGQLILQLRRHVAVDRNGPRSRHGVVCHRISAKRIHTLPKSLSPVSCKAGDFFRCYAQVIFSGRRVIMPVKNEARPFRIPAETFLP